ncbi:MAG: Stk1 family PASTA domain-containing Ser/Thr kinase [Lachnospiraceae bacterium]|nr:Stk1 family PASTA domain-containing Ser/Thr kinase [Lachnospiraceae bacterium]
MVSPGMIIGERYEILNKIGTGGMADVYKAKDHRLNRFVAIKILKQEFSEDKKFVDKFRAEAQSAAGLTHPNIVNVYDVGEDQGLHYIVMELVEGVTLKNFIENKGRLTSQETNGIAIQIVQGIQAAHDNGIIHRDIKPQNIIISRDGKVKVTDFGIAKAASSNTITSNAMGSVHYISPEQARGGYSDARSDLYSFGVTMYEMLSGRVPFQGDNTVSLALAHIQEEPVPLRQIDPEITVSMERIVMKCMQKKSERRYPNATALLEDLKRAVSDPSGSFVMLSDTLVDASPTRQFTEDETRQIKNASRQSIMNELDTRTDEDNLNLPEEKEEEGDLDPKLEKLMFAGSIVVAILVVVFIIIIVVKLMGMGKSKEVKVSPSPSPTATASVEPVDEEEKVEMPEVLGKTKAEAYSELTALGLEVETKEMVSKEYEEGQVCEQYPVKGAELVKGDKVTIYVNTGDNKIDMPDVKNQSKDDASVALSLKGFKIAGFEEEFSEDVKEGYVTRTDPEAGARVAEGESVTVYISKGPEEKKVKVPDLSKCTEAQAEEALADVGLIGEVSAYKYSDTVKKGYVIKQSKNAGAEVKEGTTISYTVSMGKEESYSYKGTITIGDNPFDYEDEQGTIRLVLTQDGSSQVVFEQTMTFYDFPLKKSVEGKSDSAGTIEMFLNGKKVGGTYSITFKKVKK